MSYTPLFDPNDPASAARAGAVTRLGDRGAQPVYVYDDRIVLAVNVALATGRPLLVSGEAGTGKSSLARAVAAHLGWRYLAHVVSSRTQARDLLFTFDTVRRLADAQVGPEAVQPDAAYLEPGPLWWAFDPPSAARRGLPPAQAQSVPDAIDPAEHPQGARTVLLLDEIDKADPDVPNDLLEPLGSFRFRIPGVAQPIEAAAPPFVCITTNDERDLPRAFVRRCVCLALEPPAKERLLQIARRHFPTVADGLLDEVADRYFATRQSHHERRVAPPGTAEYLDAISAFRELQLLPGSAEWQRHAHGILNVTLEKSRHPPAGGTAP